MLNDVASQPKRQCILQACFATCKLQAIVLWFGLLYRIQVDVLGEQTVHRSSEACASSVGTRIR